jgi:hypothetical protein
VGEHIAAAAIIKAGYRCNIVNSQGYDILLFHDRDIYRVEVKSTTKPKAYAKHHKNYKPYSYYVSRGSRSKRLISVDDADIVALVANDIKAVIFLPVKSLKVARVRKRPEDFGDETDSLNVAMEIVRNDRLDRLSKL